VSVFRARSVSITCERPFTMYADGDPIGDLPVTVSALQAAVRMLVPLVGPDDPAFGSEG
jgi:diacylglycerol kinase family enzyme